MVLILRISLIICLTVMSRALISKQIGKIMGKKLKNLDGEKILIGTAKYKFVVKAIYSSFIIFIALFTGNSVIKSFFLGVATILIINSFESIKRNTRKKEVLQDLLNVTECLRVQLSSNISLGIALRSISELCKNKEFSLELTNLYLEYELSKFTIMNSAKELINKFNYPETKMFISAINQQIQHTSALEAFDNLIEVLKEKYVEYMEETTRTKSLIMIGGVCIVVFNIAAMSIYPIIVEASEAIEVMFL